MAFSLTSTDVRLDGTTLRARCKTDDGKLVDSALDLNPSIGNNKGNFCLPGRMFGASASEILLTRNRSTLLAVFRTPQQDWIERLINLNVCIRNNNGALTFVKPTQRITQSCSATFLQGSILKGLCLGSDGKLHPSTIDLNQCYSNNNGHFADGGKVFNTARMMELVPGDGKVILRGQLLSRDDGWQNAEVDLSLSVVNIDGKFNFVTGGGRFDPDGPVDLSFNIAPLTQSVVEGLPLLAGNDAWAKCVATFCSNSPIICVILALGALFGGPLGAVVSAGIIKPIGKVVESAITGVIKDPVLKGKYEEAIVGYLIRDTISLILVEGGAELLAEAVGTLAGLNVETAVAEVRGVFRGAKVEVAELGSYRLLEKVVGAVSKKDIPEDWLETLEEVGKLEQA